MEKVIPGMLARSKAGHDKGDLYLIDRVEPEYAYLVDGSRRPLSKPKKKKWKHIQIIKQMPEHWNPEQKNDDDIRRAIRQYETASAKRNLIKVEERNV
ncbi:MAG: hypothetical protein HFI29_14530 [Lachnospiraceae bacterium]|jgi:hypothetical protein|nr:hypothetical protein [Lachnospiraceae bacterium]